MIYVESNYSAEGVIKCSLAASDTFSMGKASFNLC